MIDWFALLASAIWIVGLGVLLALFGFARMSPERSIRRAFAQPHYRVATMLALVLFASGMSLSVGTWFERVGWIAVVALALWEAYSARRARGAQ